MKTPTESLTSTLLERVDMLLHGHQAPLEWGNPLLSSTPRSHAVHDLAIRTEALEHAVREIALDLQKLSVKT